MAAIASFIAPLRAASRAARTPSAVLARFDAAFNDGDLAGVMDLFEPGAVMRLVDGAVIAGDEERLRQAFRQLLAGRPTIENAVRRVLQSGDTALVLADWTMTWTSADGMVERAEGTATQVMARSGDGTSRLKVSNPLGIV